MNEEQPIFKVTDRRLFNADGTPREVERLEEAPAKEAKTGESSSKASPSQAQRTPSSTEKSSSASAEADPGQGSAPPAETHSSTQQKSATQDKSADETPSARPAIEDHTESPEDVYAESEIPGAEDPASFLNFLMSIASNAAAALGMMEHPVTGERAVEPELAKHWIDVLGMLQQKTRGNLAPQEQQIFEGLLADLRMQYVSLSGAGQPKSARFTGRDITGAR